jgi:hypothetical protein
MLSSSRKICPGRKPFYGSSIYIVLNKICTLLFRLTDMENISFNRRKMLILVWVSWKYIMKMRGWMNFPDSC